MLGDFINRCLILVLGYAYPAFECYKIVEKNRVEIEDLRFWCQYWILVAILTVLERVTDLFVSWLPMYGEMKLAFFIYLWYPKTQGTGYIYQTMLRPYVSKRETDIDRKILEMRARVWDLAIYNWQNCAQLGQDKFFDILKFLAGQTSKYSNNTTTTTTTTTKPQPEPEPEPEKQKQSQQPNTPTAPPLPPHGFNSPRTPKPFNSKHWGSVGSPRSSSTVNRAVSDPTRPNIAHVNTRVSSEPRSPDDGYIPDSPTTPSTPNDNLLQARLRLRRQKGQL